MHTAGLVWRPVGGCPRDVIYVIHTDPEGAEQAVRFDLTLEKPGDGPDGRFRWRTGRSGDKAKLHDLRRLG
jgi:hypothetical protein